MFGAENYLFLTEIHLVNPILYLTKYKLSSPVIFQYEIEMFLKLSTTIIHLCVSPPAAATAAKLLQSCPTLGNPMRPCRRQLTRLPRPWDSPGKNTRVGCHFLQCMKVKSESEVALSCPTPSVPMDCSPPGSSVHGIFQARVLEWGAIAIVH